jgi:hypothetical protein
MKLSRLDLDLLRRGLRNHPRIAQEVASLDLDRMRTRELVTLTSRLGFDARALIDTVREQDDERRHERMDYSTRFPAFGGTLDFELTFELLGKRVTRKARADYSYTPEWEYFDLRKQAPYVGWPGSGLCISVRTTQADGWDDGPGWEKIDILNVMEIWNIIDDAIEERCKVEDAKRRRAAARKQ